jgi:hypothetical protein
LIKIGRISSSNASSASIKRHKQNCSKLLHSNELSDDKTRKTDLYQSISSQISCQQKARININENKNLDQQIVSVKQYAYSKHCLRLPYDQRVQNSSEKAYKTSNTTTRQQRVRICGFNLLKLPQIIQTKEQQKRKEGKETD